VRRLSALPVAGALAALLALWLALGGADDVARAAASAQRDAQNLLARSLRALRAGEPGALWTLWGLCFLYGVLHAAGPGHGKVVVGAYGLGRRVPWARLAGLALAASLGQAVTAVALVGAGVLLLGWGREEMAAAADGALAALSAVLVGALGVWLLAAPAQALRAAPVRHDPTFVPALDEGLDRGAHAVCASCGHAHGPSLHEVEAAGTLREMLALVVAVAARPCTGALFLLLLTWRMGLFAQGVAGAFAMALGTAAVTVAVAVGAVLMREGALASVPRLPRALPLLEVAAGLLVVLVASALLRGA
jgi:nickel/cobalt exporter